MNNIRHSTLAAGLALALLAVNAPGVRAQTWTKPAGYAGNLPATAQITAGIGALTTITGTLNVATASSTTLASGPDLFQIFVTGTGLFSATTFGTNTSVFDPRLFLFDSTGKGVFFNDDASINTPQSTLNPSTSLTPGLYYLGVSVHGVIPRSAVPVVGPPAVPTTSASDIFPTIDDFPTTGFTGLWGPTGPGGGSPLLSWSLSSGDVETGSYTILLTGAAFAAAPEPGEAAAWGIGLVGLSVLVLRARKRPGIAAS